MEMVLNINNKKKTNKRNNTHTHTHTHTQEKKNSLITEPASHRISAGHEIKSTANELNNLVNEVRKGLSLVN